MKIYKDGKSEVAVYRGDKYRRYPGSQRRDIRGYYQRREAGKTREYLHREIYRKEVGEIPDGYNVHHKDGDPLNNEVSNLACISKAEHQSIHAKMYYEKNESTCKAKLERIRPLAREWQQSDEGKAHYKRMAKISSKNRENKKYVCDFCREVYFSKSVPKTRFCSPTCRGKWRRASGVDNEERTCTECGNRFTVNKYTKTKVCCKECGIVLRRRRNK